MRKTSRMWRVLVPCQGISVEFGLGSEGWASGSGRIV